MSSAVITQVVKHLEVLPFDLQNQVLHFVQSLESALMRGVQSPDSSVIRGVPGRQLLRFAGTIPTEDLQLMRQIIEEGCEQVDLDEW